MQVVCGSVLRAGYMNVNINLLGTGGTARTARCNFPHIKALEVVRYGHKFEFFIHFSMFTKFEKIILHIYALM